MSLFDTPDQWVTDPIEAFKSFVMSPAFVQLGRRSLVGIADDADQAPLLSASAKTYIAMFGRLHAWMTEQGKTLHSVDDLVIREFLDTRNARKRPLNSAIRIRYVRLLERIYDHLQVQPNPARRVAFQIFKAKSAAGADKPKAWVDDAQQAAFMAAMPSPDNWKNRRDRAMLSMMLGAGLKVSEVISVRVADLGKPEADGSVPVTVKAGAQGSSGRHHRTMLRPFAASEVLAWICERREVGFAGDLLFPSTPTGERLDPSTVFRKVRATFKSAGLNPHRSGGRTLRNSFAIRELTANGRSADANAELVGEFLGLHEKKSTLRYVVHAGRAGVV